MACSLLLRVVADIRAHFAPATTLAITAETTAETSNIKFGRYNAREACAYAEALCERLAPAQTWGNLVSAASPGRNVLPYSLAAKRTWRVLRDDPTTGGTHAILLFDADTGEILQFSRPKNDDSTEGVKSGAKEVGKSLWIAFKPFNAPIRRLT